MTHGGGQSDFGARESRVPRIASGRIVERCRAAAVGGRAIGDPAGAVIERTRLRECFGRRGHDKRDRELQHAIPGPHLMVWCRL
jgi:hypothetical protein